MATTVMPLALVVMIVIVANINGVIVVGGVGCLSVAFATRKGSRRIANEQYAAYKMEAAQSTRC